MTTGVGRVPPGGLGSHSRGGVPLWTSRWEERGVVLDHAAQGVTLRSKRVSLIPRLYLSKFPTKGEKLAERHTSVMGRGVLTRGTRQNLTLWLAWVKGTFLSLLIVFPLRLFFRRAVTFET